MAREIVVEDGIRGQEQHVYGQRPEDRSAVMPPDQAPETHQVQYISPTCIRLDRRPGHAYAHGAYVVADTPFALCSPRAGPSGRLRPAVRRRVVLPHRRRLPRRDAL